MKAASESNSNLNSLYADDFALFGYIFAPAFHFVEAHLKDVFDICNYFFVSFSLCVTGADAWNFSDVNSILILFNYCLIKTVFHKITSNYLFNILYRALAKDATSCVK